MALLSPIQDGAMWGIADWIRIKPRITQKFGNDLVINGVHVYQEMGLNGHDGIDYGVPSGTVIFAPKDGIIKVKDSGDSGYGLHFKIRNAEDAQEFVGGHLSKVLVADGQRVHMGDKIALSGNSGFSTADHFHGGFRLLKPSDKDLFSWEVLDYNNGYFGYIDYQEFEICFKGNQLKNSL